MRVAGESVMKCNEGAVRGKERQVKCGYTDALRAEKANCGAATAALAARPKGA